LCQCYALKYEAIHNRFICNIFVRFTYW
jgi:hypothetical protein